MLFIANRFHRRYKIDFLARFPMKTPAEAEREAARMVGLCPTDQQQVNDFSLYLDKQRFTARQGQTE